MSDRPIQVGDLVVVARPTDCCGIPGHIGRVFRVAKFTPAKWICSYCSQNHDEQLAGGVEHINGYEVQRLKRIQPLSELEGERTQEDLREPA